MDCLRVVNNITGILETYIRDYDIKALIQGVSGGVDSALTCALAYKMGIPLIGRSLPTTTNKDDEIKRAKMVGEAFCHNFKEVSIVKMFDTLDEEIINEEGKLTEKKERIRRGNIKARIRMIYLYDLAFQHDGIVLSNDNKTELELGFWTKNGDVGDIGLIQHLWKSEVYDLAYYVSELLVPPQSTALKECIAAIPTDGLGVSSSDLEQLGANTYTDVDNILKQWFYAKEKNLWTLQEELRNSDVVQRHERTHHKRRGTYNISREELFA